MRIFALLALLVAASAPAATTYTTDASRSTLGFTTMQSGADVDGRFATFRATIVFSDADLAASRFDVEVDTKSVDTGDDDRDAALRSEDLFSVEKYPKAHFVATSFTRRKAGEYEATGKLTVRDVTRQVHIHFTFESVREGEQSVAWLKGEAPLIKRLDFGVGQGEWQDTSVVANEVTVEFALRLIPSATPDAKKPSTPPAKTPD